MLTIRTPLLAAAIVTMVFVSGCGTGLETTATGPLTATATRPGGELSSRPGLGSAEAGFYPLASGNHWSYTRESSYDFRPPSGPPELFSSTIETDQTCEESRNGRVYLVERSVETSSEGTVTLWSRVRQDRTGLFEVDFALPQPPLCDERVPPAASCRSSSAPEVGFGLRELCARPPADQQAAGLVALERAMERVNMIRAALGLTPRANGRRVVEPPEGELLRLSYPLRTSDRSRWLRRRGWADPGAVENQ